MRALLAWSLMLAALVLWQVVVRLLVRKRALDWRVKGFASLAVGSIFATLSMLLMLIDGDLATIGLLQIAKYGWLTFLFVTFGSILLWFLILPWPRR